MGRFYLKYKIMKWQEISKQEKTPAVLPKKGIFIFFNLFLSPPAPATDSPSAQPTGSQPKESK